MSTRSFTFRDAGLHSAPLRVFNRLAAPLGFLGLIVAVPVAAIVQVFVREAIDWYRGSELYMGAGSE